MNSHSKWNPSGLQVDSQWTPSGLPVDSQRTPSGLPADSQLPANSRRTPNGHQLDFQQISSKVDSKQVSIWRAYLESFFGELFWRAHFESWWYCVGKSDPQQTPNKVLIGPHKTQPGCNLDTSSGELFWIALMESSFGELLWRDHEFIWIYLSKHKIQLNFLDFFLSKSKFDLKKYDE